MAERKELLPQFRVYRELVPNEHFCIFADPAEGTDYCAAVAISKKRCDTPVVYNCKTESSQFGYDLYGMARYIETKTHIWPTIAVERNTGQATIHVLVTLNYPDMFRMQTFDTTYIKETDKLGWFTTKASRKKMLDDFSLVIKQGIIKIYDRDIVDQMRAFVLDKQGRPAAVRNKHDDLVIATAGSYQMYQIVPTREADDYSVEDWRESQEKWRFR